MLFCHVGDGGDHSCDARHARAEAHRLCHAHLSGELRGHDDLTAWLYLGATADLADHAIHIYNVYTALAGILCEAAKGAKIEGCWIPGLNGACFCTKGANITIHASTDAIFPLHEWHHLYAGNIVSSTCRYRFILLSPSHQGHKEISCKP